MATNERTSPMQANGKPKSRKRDRSPESTNRTENEVKDLEDMCIYRNSPNGTGVGTMKIGKYYGVAHLSLERVAVEKDASKHDVRHSKKPRGSVPSNVLHLRNVAKQTTQFELRQMLNGLGDIVHILHLDISGQALIEMKNLEDAKNIIEHFTHNPPILHGKHCYFQFSTRKKIDSPRPKDTSACNHILLVVFYDIQANITLNDIYNAYSAYGEILKIVTFCKSSDKKNSQNSRFGRPQALIQMGSVDQATKAREALNEKAIKGRFGSMRIQYSNLKELSVPKNDAKTWDYTKKEKKKNNSGINSYVNAYGVPVRGVGVPSHRNRCDRRSNGFSNAEITDMQVSQTIQYFQPSPPRDYFEEVREQFRPRVEGASSFGTQSPFFHPSGPMFPQQAPAFSVNTYHSVMDPNLHVNNGKVLHHDGGVLLVSNLDKDQINCDILFRLFGVYGDVQRVKILFNKRDSALVQFRNYKQAEIARKYLHRLNFFGREMSVTSSKYQQISSSRDCGDELTRDYYNAKEHRYAIAGSKNFDHICPPSSTLHISNMDEETTEQELQEALEKHGIPVFKIHFLGDRHKLARVKVSSVDHAAQLIVAADSTDFNGSCIRLSFSTKAIR